jgi:hypothetical protein
MNDIQLYISKETNLRLKFFEAVHPTLVHPKADHWKFIYRLYHGDKLFDNGLFAPNYLIDEERQLLFIQEYDASILNQECIETDDDVIFNLRLFDFLENKTGKFSKLTGGSFKMHKLVDNIFIFRKQYENVTKEYEVDIDKISMVEILGR